jgi:hypothetical protein
MPRWARIIGVNAVFLVGAVSAAIAFRLPEFLSRASQDWGTTADRSTAWRTIKSVPLANWIEFRTMFVVIALALILFGAIAFWFAWQERPRFAVIAIAAALIPIGFSMMDGVARVAPYFSLADAAEVIQQQIAPDDIVVYEGPMHVGSSLLFYLGQRFYLVNEDPASEPGAALSSAPDIFLNEEKVAREWAGRNRVYLLVEESRVPYWRERLKKSGRPVGTLTTCGTTVLLTNRRQLP